MKEKQVAPAAAMIELLLARANSRANNVELAGDGDHVKPNYHVFSPFIMLGENSHAVPDSFDGYIKELQIFSKYHNFEQMKIDKLRIFYEWSYDDEFLIANWKLTENYTSTDLLYTIKDSSFNQLNVTVSLTVHPDYPSFNYSAVDNLNLCLFHDVSNCLGPDTSGGKLSTFVYGAWRYGVTPYLNIGDTSDFTITDGDELTFTTLHSSCTDVKAHLW